MARIRSLKPELPQSESMGRVSREARLAFILLFTVADDSGRLRGNSRLLASTLYPYDDDAAGCIDRWLSELEQEACIKRYVIDGDSYIEILNWLKHQKIDKVTPSKLPKFDNSSSTPREESPTTPRVLTLGLEGKGMDMEGKRNGKRHGPAPPSSAFDEFWRTYPRKTAKANAEKAWERIKPSTDLVAKIMAAVKAAAELPDWQRDNFRYVPHAATWLNGRRWEDDLATSKARPHPPGMEVI